jgi:hypothetical protein
MWPFPKQHFKWREPKEFRQTLHAMRASKARWWHKPLAGFVLACLFMSQWALAQFNPKKRPPSFETAFAIAFLGSMFLVYFVAWMHRLAPSYVAVFENYMFRTIANTHGHWKFDVFDSFAIHNCDNFRVLVLELRRGGQVLIGVPREVDLPALQAFFEARGLREVTGNPVANSHPDQEIAASSLALQIGSSEERG